MSHQARWVNWESTEQATTSVLIAWNSCTRSLKAMISVGHTKVLQKKPQKHHMLQNIMIIKKKCLHCYSQVQGIEEEDKIFASVVWQSQLFEFPINNSCSFPVWCRLWNWKSFNHNLCLILRDFLAKVKSINIHSHKCDKPGWRKNRSFCSSVNLLLLCAVLELGHTKSCVKGADTALWFKSDVSYHFQ